MPLGFSSKHTQVDIPDLNKIVAEMRSRLDGVNITLDVLVKNDPLILKMEAAKTTLEECLSIIAKYTQKEAADV